MQSGTSLSYWVITNARVAKEFAKKLNLNSDNEYEILKSLQEIPVDKLIRGQDLFRDKFFPASIRPFAPVIEKPSPYEESFMTQHPLSIIRSGNYMKIPMIMGYTNREGNGFIRIETKKLKDFELMVHHYFKYPHGSPASLALAKKIKEFYFGSDEYTDETIEKYAIMRTDLFLLSEIFKTIQEHLDTSSQPIYFYRFSAELGLNFSHTFGKNLKGAYHADELPYLFKSAIDPDVKPESIEWKCIQRMCKLWANFAKTGDPNQKIQDSLINVTWSPVEQDKLHFIDIGEKLQTGINPEPERKDFWESVYRTNPCMSKL